MTDWKEAARKHEASADGYARLYHEAVLANAELVEVLSLTLTAIKRGDIFEVRLAGEDVETERGMIRVLITEAIRNAKGG